MVPAIIDSNPSDTQGIPQAILIPKIVETSMYELIETISESDVQAMNSEYQSLSLQLANIRHVLMRIIGERYILNNTPVESLQFSVVINNRINALTRQIADLDREMGFISRQMSQIEQQYPDILEERQQPGGKRRKSRSRKTKRRRATRRRRTKK